MVATINEMWGDRFKRASLVATLFITFGGAVAIILWPPWRVYDPMPEVEPRMEIIPVDMEMVMAGGNEGSTGGSPNDTPFDKPVSNDPKPKPTTSSQHVTTTPDKTDVNVNTGTGTSPTVNQNALFTKPTGNGTGGGNGDDNGPGTGHGDGPGTGTTNGNSPSGIGTGNYSLAGRSALEKPTPKNVVQKEGKIVVNIWVDRNGKVTRTKVNLDLSTINDSKLAAECEKAAKNTVWSENEDADEEQKGTITYNFKLN